MAPKPRDLCTLDEVRRRVGLKAGQATDVNVELEQMISSVSTTVYRKTGREFVARNAVFTDPGNPSIYALTVASEVRSIVARGSALSLGDITELVDLDGSTDIAGWTLLPYGRSAGEPIEALGYPATLYPYEEGTIVLVKAKWGWPAVPDDVREAVRDEVARRYKRNTAKQAETFNEEEPARRSDRELGVAWDTVMGYRRIGPIFA